MEKENPGAPGADAGAADAPVMEASVEGRAHQTGPAEDAPPVRQKPDSLNRAIARFIDLLIALLFGMLPDYIGFFSALTYIGIADGLMGGRSIGKRIIGLRVYNTDRKRPGDFRDSILRNSTIGLVYILSRIPFVGWILAGAGLGFELILIIGSPQGRRLGDEIASTVVKEYEPQRVDAPA